MATMVERLDPTRRSAEAAEFALALRRSIVGQEEGVQAVVDLYQVFRAGMNVPGRPIGNLLFLGPTGSGKTRIVEATAEVLFGDPRAVLKVDCAEFQHCHEIAKLIGSPPGYLGHRETHPLITQESLDAALSRQPQALARALRRDREGFRRSLAAPARHSRQGHADAGRQPPRGSLPGHDLHDLEPRLHRGHQADDRRPGIFPARATETRTNSIPKIYRAATEAARRKFSPEFLNRIDKVIVFRALQPEQLEKVLDIELRRLQERILATAPEVAAAPSSSASPRRRATSCCAKAPTSASERAT